MKDKQRFIDDTVEIALEKFEAGTLSRRGFNQALMVMAAMAGLGPLRSALAGGGSLVVSNWRACTRPVRRRFCAWRCGFVVRLSVHGH